MSHATWPAGHKQTCPASRNHARSNAPILSLAAALVILGTATTPLKATDECRHRRALDNSCADDGYWLGGADDGFSLGGLSAAPSADSRPAVWTGLYLGADLGGAVGGVATRGITTGDIDVAGLIGTIHAGYSILWDNFLLGVEFDITRSGADGDRRFPGGIEVTSDINWLSSSRLRLGYATGDLLIYATGGFAYAQQDLQFDSPATMISDNDGLFGYAVGGGVEMKLSESLSARVEAIHYGFGEQSFDVANEQLEADTDLTTIRAGLSMHFN